MTAPVGEINLNDSVVEHMRAELPRLHVGQTVGEAIAVLRQSPPAARIVYFYVVDQEGRLKGVIPARSLLLSPPEATLDEIMLRRVVAVPQRNGARRLRVLRAPPVSGVSGGRSAGPAAGGDRRGTVYRRTTRPGRRAGRRPVSTGGRPPGAGRQAAHSGPSAPASRGWCATLPAASRPPSSAGCFRTRSSTPSPWPSSFPSSWRWPRA